jgi:peptidyl-prolyl cis-trans isomerase D
MLKVMRNSFQHLKWILVFIVGVFILFIFVDWGAGGAGGGTQEDTFAARVNGQTVSNAEFQRALVYTKQRYAQAYGQQLTPEMEEALGLPRQVLNGLIDDTLLLQEARRLDLNATDAEIRKEIMKMPVFQDNGKFVGPEGYERFVKSNLRYPSPAAFEEDIGRSVTLEKINSALRNTMVVTPALAENEYRRRNESAKIRYALLPADSLVSSVSATPAEIEAWFRTHTSDYSHAEQRNVKYLLADLARIRSQITVTEADLRPRYESMKDQFKSGEAVRASHILLKLERTATPEQQAAVEKKANALAAQVRAGADFGRLARENSQDPSSAAVGGDLGFFERGRMVAEFDQAAFSTPVGSVVGPVKTMYGYHIIKVTETRPAGFKPFAEVRDQLDRQVREQKALDLARERIAQAKVRIDQAKHKNVAELRAFADDTVSFNETGWFGKTDQIPGLGRAPALNDWAFNAKVGDIGNQTETGRGPIIPYLSGARESGIAPLDEVRQRVEMDVKRQKAREAAKKELEAAFASRSVDAVAKQFSVTPVEATVNRMGIVTGLSGDVQPLVNAALSAEASTVVGPIVVDQGAVVFEVQERKKFNPQEFAANKASILEMIQQSEAPKLRASLLARLRERADIEINPRIVQTTAPAPPA